MSPDPAPAQQRVYLVRRDYNRWVANETLEDYALRFTAKSARKWSSARVSNTALGAISFLALEAIGGTITLQYGFISAFYAILVVGLLIFLTALPLCYHAARLGTDIDLLTRAAGFGYIGSTITSLIYASFTFIFFAIEAAIMAVALQLALGLPLSLGYVVSALVVIPLVTHGITLISRFQVWSQPIWLILQILPFLFIAAKTDGSLAQWIGYKPNDGATAGFDLLAFGAACSILFSLIAQVGEQVDFLRFLPREDSPSRRWWSALVFAGPGWILLGSVKILIGSYLAVFALSHGVSFTESSDPNHMYRIAFGYIHDSPWVAAILGALFVILSQIKINVTNAYAGSIAWSNFFSRLTHNHPGRVVWLVFNVAIALLLMELGIYRILVETLSVYSILAVAWVGSIVADLVINRPLGLRPRAMEFKRAHLYDINPVGVGAMLMATTLGLFAHLGAMGDIASALSAFVTLGSALLIAPIIAWLTGGRFYIAREPVKLDRTTLHSCVVCEHQFEAEDMTHCPAYAGNICSLCCTLDSRCEDMCKPGSRLSSVYYRALAPFNRNGSGMLSHTNILHFLGVFIITSLLIMGLLSLVYYQITLDSNVNRESVASALINIFLLLSILSGVVAWMFALAQDSRRVAHEETHHQTLRLIEEIEAHKRTDIELQLAKETAEAANLAKSRYLTGISHELRSPLNAIMGYAQLLEKDEAIPRNKRRALNVIRRSSEHLADLIEGLLDISRIEAGRLVLSHDEVNISLLLDQLVNMFELQAHNKGIQFDYERLSPLPELVRTDEKRLRQILINLLSNAVKYTPQGGVKFTVKYRNQVAVFCIEDSGVGIPDAQLQTIFKPFERLTHPNNRNVPGTGLGLTITTLLTDIMGGDLQVSSQPDIGSRFTLSMMLSSSTTAANHSSPEKARLGYSGERKTIFVVDDEPTHRSLLRDMLEPLGFELVLAQDAETCLEMLRITGQQPDIFMLDINMPGLNGWELAVQLRQRHPGASIILTSANADQTVPAHLDKAPHDAYLVKPIAFNPLLDRLGECAGLEWLYAPLSKPGPLELAPGPGGTAFTPDATQLAAVQDLLRLARIGYITGVQKGLDSLKQAGVPDDLIERLDGYSSRFELDALISELEKTL